MLTNLKKENQELDKEQTSPTFKIGDIVTLRTHPLSFQSNGLIDLHVSHIPPFMCIKEVYIENKKLKFSPENGSELQMKSDISVFISTSTEQSLKRSSFIIQCF